MERDLDADPYSPEEQRVCEYLQRISNNMMGCGDDPVSFLIASHGALAKQLAASDAVIFLVDINDRNPQHPIAVPIKPVEEAIRRHLARTSFKEKNGA